MIFQRGDGFVNSNGEPVSQDGKPLGEVQDTAAQVAALTEQRDSLQAQVDAGTTEAQGKLDALTSERDTLKGTLESVAAERDQALAVAESNRDGLSQMASVRDALTTQLEEAKARISALESAPTPGSDAPALPADARERLIEINGIGEKLADKVLEVLAAAPAPAEQ